MVEQTKKREVWIDYMKAVACISVLVFHVIYGLQNAGIPCGRILTIIKELCGIFQIPVFLFASGYLYGKKKTGNYGVFLGRKFLNLGIPYIVFSVVYYLINTSFRSSVNFSYTIKDIIGIYKMPLAQYWYIFATLLIFLVLPILEKVIANEWLLLAFLATWKIVNMFWISETNYDYYFAQYAVYFYLGTLYSRHHNQYSFKEESKGSWIKALVVFVVLFVSAFFYSWEEAFSVVLIFLAIVSIYLLGVFLEKKEEQIQNPFLNIVSKYSFQIYLVHTMVTAAVRIVLVKLGIQFAWIHFIFGTGIGLGATIFGAYICEKTVILNIVFFPEATVKKLRSRKRK